jgi:mono/diheme cytochrome c family protein
MRLAIILAAGLIGGAAPAADVARGKLVFDRVCAPCHGQGRGDDGPKMLPGSAALAAKYKGELSPFLEKRADLGTDQLRYFVRHGSGAMPMFRKTEISDADVDAVAAYIGSTSKKANQAVNP